MPCLPITLPLLCRAYEQWLGRPVSVVSLRRPEEHDDVPAELDILFFQPENQDELLEEDRFTYIATAGLSTRHMPESGALVELVMRIDGPYALAALEDLARALAEIGVLPFRDGIDLAPNMLVHGTTLPLFEAMTSLVVTHWGVSSPQWLPGLEPPVLVLSLQPVYGSEAEMIETLGVEEAGRRFVAEEINWHNPRRDRADLTVPAPASNEEWTEPMTDDELRAAVARVWQQIEDWYQQHAPTLLEWLKKGASDKQIADLERRLDLDLPAEYRASLKRHNGQGYVAGYTYLATKSVLRTWQSMNERSEQGDFAGRQRADQDGGRSRDTWWDRGWIPFAEDSVGNLLCLDMAPGARGHTGQILALDGDEGPVATPYLSFLDWLTVYYDDLERGMYDVDESGWLVKR